MFLKYLSLAEPCSGREHRPPRGWLSAPRRALWLVLGLALSACGATGIEAPPPPELDEGSCQPMDETLSELFGLLHSPATPLSPLREVVVEISSLADEECERRGAQGAACYHPVGAILDAVVSGIVTFSRDPDEGLGTRCLELAPSQGENRLCSLRRALDLAIRDAAAEEILGRLNPMVAELLGWVMNEGPGADGKTHYEVLGVVQQITASPGICQPTQLFDLIDALLDWWRPDASCQAHVDGENCRALGLLGLLRSLVSDAALQEFLELFESEDGSGRVAFLRVAGLLMARMAEMPENGQYFDAIDRIANELLFPFLNREERYGPLKEKIAASMDVAREFLDPSRDRAVLRQFKGVVSCFNTVDHEEMLVVGALYDLLIQPSGSTGTIDLVKVVTVFEDLVRHDSQRNGVLLGAIQTMVRGTRDDEQGTEAMRRLLVEILSEKSARRVMPPLRLMIERGVLSELILLVDDLLYGCRGGG